MTFGDFWKVVKQLLGLFVDLFFVTIEDLLEFEQQVTVTFG